MLCTVTGGRKISNWGSGFDIYVCVNRRVSAVRG